MTKSADAPWPPVVQMHPHSLWLSRCSFASLFFNFRISVLHMQTYDMSPNKVTKAKRRSNEMIRTTRFARFGSQISVRTARFLTLSKTFSDFLNPSKTIQHLTMAREKKNRDNIAKQSEEIIQHLTLVRELRGLAKFKAAR